MNKTLMAALILSTLSIGQAQAITVETTTSQNLVKLQSEYFTILYNCEMKGYEHYNYVTKRDTGNHKRKSSFYQDPRLSKECQLS